ADSRNEGPVGTRQGQAPAHRGRTNRTDHRRPPGQDPAGSRHRPGKEETPQSGRPGGSRPASAPGRRGRIDGDSMLRIKGGKVYDPANNVNGEIKDVCISDGRIVT